MRPVDADALKKAIELICEDERTNMTAIAYFALMELVDTMPTIGNICQNHRKENSYGRVYKQRSVINRNCC